MSDNWFTFVSSDPKWTPSDEVAGQLEDIARSEFPDADEISTEFHEQPAFINPVANLETVHCPSCDSDIMDWWQDQMEATDEEEFASLDCTVPCCGTQTSLNDLKYDWPAAFACFQLDVMNPNMPDAPEAVIEAFQTIAATHIRTIRTHI
jgi:DNA-directed RNA polymerase subunit M/transcription elongation factor TFIIS